MPRMRSPDGKEEFDVPNDSLAVAHYRRLGATVVEPLAPPAATPQGPAPRLPRNAPLPMGSQMVRGAADLLRMVGGTGGAIAGSLAGPLGGLAGGMAGGAGSEALAQMMDEGIGLEAPGDPMRDILTGGALGALPGVGGMAMAAARPLVRMAGRVASTPILRRLPGASVARNVVKDIEEIGAKAKPKATPKPKAEAKPEAKRKPYRPPKKAKAAPKRDPTAVEKRVRATKAMRRPATMSAEEQAAAREAGREQVTGAGRDLRRLGPSGEAGPGKSQAMRGASGPALERRAAARARLLEPELPELDLMDPLEASLMIEQRMAAEGLSPAERMLVRAAIRQR